MEKLITIKKYFKFLYKYNISIKIIELIVIKHKFYFNQLYFLILIYLNG